MAKSISDLKTLGEDDPKKSAAVSTKLRGDWNNFTAWLRGKGMQGNPALDRNDLGGKMIDQYQKENPETSVSRSSVAPIQQELSKYREYSINELRNKRAMLTDAQNPNGRFVSPNENLDGYMKDLSQIDGIAGQRTTRVSFPDEYMKILDAKNKLIKTERVGFATDKK